MADDRPLMFPLMLDVTTVPIFLIGAGAGLVPRLDALKAYGARSVQIFCPKPEAGIAAGEGVTLHQRWPAAEDFRAAPRLVFIDGIDDGEATRWRTMARDVGALVHVQDRIPLCDFHMPAILRRGHLQLTVSTDGTAPGLARVLRDYLAKAVFGPQWAARVDEVAAARDSWRRDGLPMSKLGDAVRAFIQSRKWLGGN